MSVRKITCNHKSFSPSADMDTATRAECTCFRIQEAQKDLDAGGFLDVDTAASRLSLRRAHSKKNSTIS